MKNKINIYRSKRYIKGIKYLLVLLVLLTLSIFQSTAYAQEQWRVFTIPSGARCMVIDRNNVKWIAGNGLVKLEGNNWTVYDTSNSPIPFAQIFSIAVDSSNNIWMGSWQGGGLVKFDGVNWTIYNTTNSGIPHNTVFSIAVDKDNIKWIGTSNSKMCKFNDTSWIVYDLSYFGLPYNAVFTTTLENNIKWFGTNSAGIAKYNDTNSIVYNYSNSGIPSDDIRSIAIDTFGNKWIATQFGGVAVFNSNLNQWTVYNTTNSPLPENHIWAMFVDKKNTKWIGCNSAGIAKYNGNWILYNTSNSPLPSNSINYFSEDKFGNIWICCGFLVIYNEDGIISVNNDKEQFPKYFALFQNYPNPFNPKTIIRYELSKNTIVKLVVYSVAGSLVSVLINKFQSTGKHEVVFDGTNLPSGIYFYRIEAEQISESRKMILIK